MRRSTDWAIRANISAEWIRTTDINNMIFVTLLESNNYHIMRNYGIFIVLLFCSNQLSYFRNIEFAVLMGFEPMTKKFKINDFEFHALTNWAKILGLENFLDFWYSPGKNRTQPTFSTFTYHLQSQNSYIKAFSNKILVS